MEAVQVQQILAKDGEVLVTGLPYLAGQAVEIIVFLHPTTQPPRASLTVGRLRRSGLLGLWQDRDDIGDSSVYPRQLREQAQKRARHRLVILLDSDVLIDLLRKYAPAMEWFDTLREDEELVVSGYVVMELIQGCRNKVEQDRVQRELAIYGVVWLSPTDCDRALEVFSSHRLSHNAGLLDVLMDRPLLLWEHPSTLSIDATIISYLE